MKIYRLDMSNVENGHQGYEWFANSRDARKRAAEFNRDNADADPSTEIEALEIFPNRKDLLTFLNYYASHADNG